MYVGWGLEIIQWGVKRPGKRGETTRHLSLISAFYESALKYVAFSGHGYCFFFCFFAGGIGIF
jgi:hypothetical protein